MRKIIVLEHISLDGIIQAPGGQAEDSSGGFAHGGWISPFSDAVLGAAIRKQMHQPFDLLLGRKTFEIWAPYWPEHGDIWPEVNTAAKYIASNTISYSKWQPSRFLNGDIAEKVRQIKQESGPDLNIWGSSVLVQTLIKQDLIDRFWLMIYPITLGSGKRLFADRTFPQTLQLTESTITPAGVIIATYDRAS